MYQLSDGKQLQEYIPTYIQFGPWRPPQIGPNTSSQMIDFAIPENSLVKIMDEGAFQISNQDL